MAEKRVKVYATADEQKADEAEAATHGWVVLERGWTSDGRIQVVYGDRLAARRRGIRLSSIAIVVWCLLMLAWAAVGLSATNDACPTGSAYCEAGATIGRGIGVAFIGFIWFIGFAILSLVWFATRPRD